MTTRTESDYTCPLPSSPAGRGDGEKDWNVTGHAPSPTSGDCTKKQLLHGYIFLDFLQNTMVDKIVDTNVSKLSKQNRPNLSYGTQ